MLLFQLSQIYSPEKNGSYFLNDLLPALSGMLQPQVFLYSLATHQPCCGRAFFERYGEARRFFDPESRKVLDFLNAAYQKSLRGEYGIKQFESDLVAVRSVFQGGEKDPFMPRFCSPLGFYDLLGALFSSASEKERLGVISFMAEQAGMLEEKKSGSYYYFGGMDAAEIAQGLLFGKPLGMCGDTNRTFAGTLAKRLGFEYAGLSVFASKSGHVVGLAKGKGGYYLVDRGEVYSLGANLQTGLEEANRHYGHFNPFIGATDLRTAHAVLPSETLLRRTLGWIGELEKSKTISMEIGEAGFGAGLKRRFGGRLVSGSVGAIAIASPLSIGNAFGFSGEIALREKGGGRLLKGALGLDSLDLCFMEGRAAVLAATGQKGAYGFGLFELAPLQVSAQASGPISLSLEPLEVGTSAFYGSGFAPHTRFSSRAGAVFTFDKKRGVSGFFEARAIYTPGETGGKFYDMKSARAATVFSAGAKAGGIALEARHAPFAIGPKTELSAEAALSQAMLFFGSLQVEKDGKMQNVTFGAKFFVQ